MNNALADSVVTTGRYGSAITADATNNQLPTRIEVMRAGTWPQGNNKGVPLEISVSDLDQFASNFKAGIGVPGGKDFGQIPIDFSHEDYAQAAGWITDLNVEGGVLYADVTWSKAGAEALQGGMYKCFSPSFWPACLGTYSDPENHSTTAQNVLVGGALTNIPFFKDLRAIMASNAGNSADKNNKAPKENEVPTFDEVRIKDVASLTADDKKVLADNQANLSDDEKTKFADALTVVDADQAAKDKEAADKAVADAKVAADARARADVEAAKLIASDQAILASIRSGEVKMIKAAEYDALTSTVNKLEADNKAAKEREVTASVTQHIKRGAIKADQAAEWTKRIIADDTMAGVLSNLPSNKLLASEMGSGSEENDANAAFETKVKAKMDADNKLTYAEAVMQVADSDSVLANSREQQIKQ